MKQWNYSLGWQQDQIKGLNSLVGQVLRNPEHAFFSDAVSELMDMRQPPITGRSDCAICSGPIHITLISQELAHWCNGLADVCERKRLWSGGGTMWEWEFVIPCVVICFATFTAVVGTVPAWPGDRYLETAASLWCPLTICLWLFQMPLVKTV